jgi:hypothetical protein
VYQPRKLAPTGLAAVLLVAATASTAPAAAPIKLGPAEEAIETRFVLFALENLFNTTWPIPTEKEREERKARKQDPWGVGDARVVRTFLAQRERIVDDLSHRVRDAKLGGDRNAELIEALELYMKSAREHGEWYAKELDKVIDLEGALKKWAETYKQVDKQADPLRYVVARQTNAAALDYMRRPDAHPFGVFATMFLGLMVEGRIQLAVQAEAWNKFQRDHLKQARERYDAQQPPLAEALCNKVKADLAKRRKAAGELAAALAGPRKWAANDTPFAEAKSEDRSIDPFVLLRQIDAEEVATDRGNTHEAAERLAKAKRYVKLIPMVPKPPDNAFNFYRSVIYAQAGREANRAAALSVGANGFSTRKGSEASRLAVQVWQKYINNSDRDVTPEILYNLSLAMVYNGAAVEAFDTLKKASAQFLPRSSDFYYDVARLCSVAAEDTAVAFARLATTPEFAKLGRGEQNARKVEVQRRVNQMLQESSLCLQRAVCCGFKDVERARETPDLKTLREADARVLGHRRTFEQIVADQKTFANVIENIIAGK